MSIELILIHLGFILALVYFVHRSGVKHGHAELFQTLMDDNIVDPQQIITFYERLKEK